MNKYAKLYFQSLKTANQPVLGKIIPHWDKVLEMVKEYQEERKKLRMGEPKLPSINQQAKI